MSDEDVLLLDKLPAEVDFVGWVVSPIDTNIALDKITWNGAVAAGETLTWTWVARHVGGYGDVVTNTAEFIGATQMGKADAVFDVVGPEITMHPLSLPFGSQSVDAGPTISQTVTITNDGSVDLHISDVTSVGDTSEFNLADSGEATLTPGSARTIEVSFDPSSAGAKTVTLTIQSDDADEPAVEVLLSGTGSQSGYIYLPLVLRNH